VIEAPNSPETVHVCENIGPKERKMRNRVGVVGVALTFLTAAALLETHAWWPLRFLVALPMFVGAMGFFQARAHTCVAFVASGIKVMGDSRDQSVRVTDPAETAAFKKRARVIYAQGLALTAVVVALVLVLP
jgi:hypothetical protein